MFLTAWQRIPIVVKLPLLFFVLSALDFAITATKDQPLVPHYEMMFRAAVWLIIGGALVLEIAIRVRNRLIQFMLVTAFVAFAYFRFL